MPCDVIPSSGSRQWTWDSGAVLDEHSHLFCAGEPSSSSGEQLLLVSTDPTTDQCFHDGQTENAFPFICELKPDIPMYCPEDYSIYRGRCFRHHQVALSSIQAEHACNTLPGGHLAAVRSQEELEFLVRTTDIKIYLIGLTDDATEGTWLFTDGSTLPPDVSVDSNGGEGENCAFLDQSGKLDDIGCSVNRNYICMADPYSGVFLADDPTNPEYSVLVDSNITSCLPSQSVLPSTGSYLIPLRIPLTDDNGLVSVRFDRKIDCNLRENIHVLKSGDAPCDYLQSCDLMGGDVMSVTCDYRCRRCNNNGCRIVLSEISEYYDLQPGDICEITYG